MYHSYIVLLASLLVCALSGPALSPISHLILSSHHNNDGTIQLHPAVRPAHTGKHKVADFSGTAKGVMKIWRSRMYYTARFKGKDYKGKKVVSTFDMMFRADLNMMGWEGKATGSVRGTSVSRMAGKKFLSMRTVARFNMGFVGTYEGLPARATGTGKMILTVMPNGKFKLTEMGTATLVIDNKRGNVKFRNVMTNDKLSSKMRGIFDGKKYTHYFMAKMKDFVSLLKIENKGSYSGIYDGKPFKGTYMYKGFEMVNPM